MFVTALFHNLLSVLATNKSHTINNGLCFMLVNGNCQLCQSKSNCPCTNLPLLNLYLMFSPRLPGALWDYIIVCHNTSNLLCKAENDNYIIKTVSLITSKTKADLELGLQVMTQIILSDKWALCIGHYEHLGTDSQNAQSRLWHSISIKTFFFYSCHKLVNRSDFVSGIVKSFNEIIFSKIILYKQDMQHSEADKRPGLAGCGLISQAEKLFFSIVCRWSFHPQIMFKHLC